MKKNILYILIFCLMVTLSAEAQQLRTSYFMEGSTMRSNLNPALRPNRGYINIPAIGSLGVAYTSNTLSLDNVLYPNPSGKGLVTFLDESVDAGEFLGNLKKNNRLDVDLGLNVIGFGFYAGKAFWTFDVNVKTNANVGLPKGFFEFVKVGSGLDGREYDLKDMSVNVSSYAEVALGYSRPVNDRLTLGGRIKFVGGLANVKVYYDNMNVKMTEEQWSIDAKGRLDVTAAGLSSGTKIADNGREIIDFDAFNLKPNGLGGYGAGLDFGATYKLLDNLTLSAAVVDLGFIKWSGKNTVRGVSNGRYDFAGFDINGGTDHGATDFGDFEEFIQFEPTESKSYTTSLRTTINVGAEYTFLNNLFAVGLLSSTQIRAAGAYSELTAAGVVRPAGWFSATLTYSMLHGYDSFGFAINFHPSRINFFIGTDYMMLKVTPQFVPVNNRATNVYLGLAVPIGKDHNIREKQ